MKKEEKRRLKNLRLIPDKAGEKYIEKKNPVCCIDKRVKMRYFNKASHSEGDGYFVSKTRGCRFESGPFHFGAVAQPVER